MGLGRDTTFTWYGHAALRIDTPGGRVVWYDPWLTNPKSPLAPGDVDACDVLLVTHGHFDHFDDDVVEIARRTKPTWPCIHELSLYALAHLGEGADVIGMNKGGRVEAKGLGISMVHADHSAGDVLGHETPIYLGEPVGFVVEMENGFRVYVAGDTDVFGDMRLIRELHAPEMAVLPIGGHFTMDPRRAALAVELLGVRHVLPIHWGTFPVLAGTPDALRSELTARGLGAVEVHAPEPGGSID